MEAKASFAQLKATLWSRSQVVRQMACDTAETGLWSTFAQSSVQSCQRLADQRPGSQYAVLGSSVDEYGTLIDTGVDLGYILHFTSDSKCRKQQNVHSTAAPNSNREQGLNHGLKMGLPWSIFWVKK